MKIGFLGMSHLGIVSSISAASKGFQVIAMDSNPDLIRSLQRGEFPISEPDLLELYEFSKSKIRFTEAIQEVSECDLVYVSLDVATSDDGTSDLTEVRYLIDLAIQSLREQSCLIILCQVPPGFTRQIASQTNLNVYHQVETLVFGQAFKRALHPERIIYGVQSKNEPTNQLYLDFLASFNCSVIEMEYESSEFCKICINILLASSVTAANTLAELCEHIGASWNDIQRALRMDQRIGPKAYISAGLGISGGNLERDIRTSLELTRLENTECSLLESMRLNSQHRKLWPSEKLSIMLSHNLHNSTIAIWGVAYKRNTKSTKNSPSLANMRNLPERTRLNLHDPEADMDLNLIDRNLVWFKDKYDALNGVDALMILTDWEEYSHVSIDAILSRMKRAIIIDPYGMIKDKFPTGIQYFTLGETPDGRGHKIES